MHRVVEPELLDGLLPPDPEVIKSRVELRHVNRILGHKGIFSRALRRHLCSSDSRPLRFVEIGAGDGTFALRLARDLSAFGVTSEITLIDFKDLVSRETCRAFADCGWVAQSVICDVFQWLSLRSQAADVMITNFVSTSFCCE